jgi:hypothetical protein
MAQPILLKRSSVAGKAPLAANLQYGELSINYTDGALYYLTSQNTIGSFLANGTSYSGNVFTANIASIGAGTIPFSSKLLTVSDMANPYTTSTSNGILTSLSSGGGYYLTDGSTGTYSRIESFGGQLGIGTLSNHPVYLGTNNNYFVKLDTVGTTTFQTTTTSTSTTTGAVVIAGGAGIAGNLNVGSKLTASNVITTSGLFWANGTNAITSQVSNQLANYGGNLTVNNLNVTGNAAITTLTSGNTTLSVASDTVYVNVGGVTIATFTSSGLAMAAPINMGGFGLGGLPTPVISGDAATKAYADGSSSAGAYPTGDYGTFSGALATDAFGQAITQYTVYDLSNTPNGATLTVNLETTTGGSNYASADPI